MADTRAHKWVRKKGIESNDATVAFMLGRHCRRKVDGAWVGKEVVESGARRKERREDKVYGY